MAGVTEPSLSAADVAKILGWSRKKVLTYMGRGLLPQPKMVLGRWLWTAEQVKQFQETLRKLEEIKEIEGLKQIPWRRIRSN